MGCSLDTSSYTVVCVLFLRFVLPGKGPVCCIGSNVTSLCGVVHFATCLTGRERVLDFLSILWLLGLESFVSLLIFPALSGLPSICCLCVTVFIWVSSGYSKLLSSNSLLRCVTVCSYVPFSKRAWFIDFFRCGGILAYMSWSMIAWAATPNASFANFWSSSRKSINFWFAGLKASCWNLCFLR